MNVVELPKLGRTMSARNRQSSRTSFQEAAWKRYNLRMQEEYEEEMERVVIFLIAIIILFMT